MKSYTHITIPAEYTQLGYLQPNLESGTGGTWNSQPIPFSTPDTLDYTNDTPSSNNSIKDDNKRENNTNQERRRNIRLQSGAGGDKYHNAHRFPGGHNKANAERPKPQPCDKPCDNINSGSTGNSSSDYKSRDHGAGGQSSEHARQGRDRIQKETENYLFFWRKESPFSQWHPAKFTIDGLTFNCAEQYMMYNKAKFSKNEAKLDKFSQNEKLREELVNTYPKLLVEASPHDQVWGIGLAADDPKIFDVNNWRGFNLLGKIITDVRDELLKDFLKPSI
ncbi:K09935 [Mytilus edulis]|uniref:K09935 n=1 Tax=Mytilus edulis TaxID=6550 RepID=A0A8S3UTB3_MYTED|nr:K09935 [Mytilus edulis]